MRAFKVEWVSASPLTPCYTYKSIKRIRNQYDFGMPRTKTWLHRVNFLSYLIQSFSVLKPALHFVLAPSPLCRQLGRPSTDGSARALLKVTGSAYGPAETSFAEAAAGGHAYWCPGTERPSGYTVRGWGGPDPSRVVSVSNSTSAAPRRRHRRRQGDVIGLRCES